MAGGRPLPRREHELFHNAGDPRAVGRGRARLGHRLYPSQVTAVRSGEKSEVGTIVGRAADARGGAERVIASVHEADGETDLALWTK